MNSTRLLAITFTAWISPLAGAALLPVIERDGQPHVSAATLEKEAGIVIKRLPGSGNFAACGAQQCAPLKSVLTDGGTMLVPVAGLSEALSLKATFDDSRGHVEFGPAAPREAAEKPDAARVGAIVPNLRLTQLDGKRVSLDDFRGRRVLITSWASW